MTITAEIIADSIAPHADRLTTVRCRYPKFIHGELMTHRVFSRNASSSRAIPVDRLIADVMRDPVEPSFWGKNQPGMQAAEELDGEDLVAVKDSWRIARNAAITYARHMNNRGAHKQIVNRILEPFSHINTLISSTEWSNFFELRCHPAAQPEMRMLAEAIRDAMNASRPTILAPSEWHTPFFQITDEYRMRFMPAELRDIAIRCSVARCARVSYLTYEEKVPAIEDDLKLYQRLVGSVPVHASPAEHQATPWDNNSTFNHGLYGNFSPGWVQYRKVLERNW